MTATSTLMNISNAIATHPQLEVVLAITIIGWITASWLLRGRKEDG